MTTPSRQCRVCAGPLERKPKRALYCSWACFRAATSVKKPCACCGEPVAASKKVYCSQMCKEAVMVGEGHGAWRGGRWQDQRGRVMIRLGASISATYVRRALPEHRIVAAHAIGRDLFPHELVIHISREMDDNHPDNLFICASRSEYSRRRQGSLPWPTSSNLSTYADRAADVAAQS